jgi:hypothetical protein
MSLAMMITPQELLDTSIAQLQTLAAFLDDQLADGSEDGGCGAPEAGACRELLGSLRVLIPKLEVVSMAPRAEDIERHEECDVW